MSGRRRQRVRLRRSSRVFPRVAAARWRGARPRVLPGGAGRWPARGTGSCQLGSSRGAVTPEGLEGGDDPVQAGLDAAQILGEPLLAVGVGLGDETAVGCGLPPVDLQALRGGLEVW